MGEWCAELLRDCQAWRDQGFSISTTSNDATRYYDAVVRQYTSWIDCEKLGGIEQTVIKMNRAEPDAIMSRVLTLALDLVGTARTIRLDKEFDSEIRRVVDDAKARGTEHEQMHANALSLFAHDRLTEACAEWERILQCNPDDLLALKLCYDTYFYLGDKESMRDSVSRVLPKFKQSAPCYSYLYGMYAFGLEECGQYREAERYARKGLEIQPYDAWATHAVAHCMEMLGRTDEGIKFMESSSEQWSVCSMLACHNFWHTALYYIEKGDHGTALTYFDSEIGKRARSGAMLDFVDAASILTRFEFEGINVGNRWNELLPMARTHKRDQVLTFNDAHVRMVLQRSGDNDLVTDHQQSLESFLIEGTGDNCRITTQYGLPICNAISAYHNQQYESVVAILYPIRKEIYKIGGSNAQRDLFDQFLINAAIRSSNTTQKGLSKSLLLERNEIKKNSMVGERLIKMLESKQMSA